MVIPAETDQIFLDGQSAFGPGLLVVDVADLVGAAGESAPASVSDQHQPSQRSRSDPRARDPDDHVVLALVDLVDIGVAGKLADGGSVDSASAQELRWKP